jgi:putative endonuclease
MNKKMSQAYTYILASKKNGVLYVEVTTDLFNRMYQHKNNVNSGFTKRYNIKILVYYEESNDIRDAIAREKVLKGKVRSYKIELIEAQNPEWNDLSKDWFE